MVVSYDASLAPMCGGVGAALLFCHFEKLFREAEYPAAGISRASLTAWRTGIGFRAETPQPWFSWFYKIGVLHYSRPAYAEAVRAQRAFLSERRGRYVFYAMEIVGDGRQATLHRNAELIEWSLAELYGRTPTVPAAPEYRNPGLRARSDARDFERALQGALQK